MNYSLNLQKGDEHEEQKGSWLSAIRKMMPLFKEERKGIIISSVAVVFNSGLTLLGPLVVGYVIENFIQKKDFHNVLVYSGILLVVYVGAFIANYIQMRTMGGVAQRILWGLRNTLFGKLMELPLAFFNQNKSGDLISRINNDTDKLNQFFSQGFMRFVGTFFTVTGAGIFILFINWKLALAALLPAGIIFVFVRLISSWVGKRNVKSLRATGLLSAEVQESMSNFKVILAFNRRDYFKQKFSEVNEENFNTAIGAGIANELFTPVFEWGANLALLIVLGYGIHLITLGEFTVGFLVSFVLYVTRFYDPLREMARLWSMLQSALAGWDRIGDILHMKSNLEIVQDNKVVSKQHKEIIEFKNVSFGYPDGSTVLKGVHFTFEKGKTYALVGPTGGGKTTTASLIARLYDPTTGIVFLNGKDIKTYSPDERAQKIGFILQEPFLFSGTVGENLMYGNKLFKEGDKDGLIKALSNAGLSELVARFSKGLETLVGAQGSLSLGERQIIAFIRAVLRKPEILILDEATANIDTVTEKLLEDILLKLPKETTRVIIAHRLNTIKNADGIFFVNGGEVVEAGSMEHAIDLLLHRKRKS